VRGLSGIVALTAVLLGLAAPASAAPGFRVGFGSTDVTPPKPGEIADPAAFASCAPTYDGARTFAFNEPYTDLNGNGHFDYQPPEPYCDANNNGRYDGIYSSGGVDALATRVHDQIDARAIAIGDGSKTYVYVSVVAQGLFQNYTALMRQQAVATSKTAGHTAIDDVVVSANHNESSPDTIGIYGGPETPAGVGGNSGIDDYYMAWLEGQVAKAAVAAADAEQAATLHALQYTLPPTLRVALSTNFPTTDDLGNPAAIDPKVGLLQARDASGKPIVTVMSLAAHNQEVGHSDRGKPDKPPVDMSSDWPGYFATRLEQQLGGHAMFLVGDNGSEEDPITVPALPKNDADPYPQAKATGEALADALVAQVSNTHELRFGQLDFKRSEFTVPLENNAFKAAAAAGIFGDRQTYAAGKPAGRGGTDLLTEVSALRVGPDLQLLGNPGEAFPGLIVGTPFGIEEAPCPSRANPSVPTWNAVAPYRFQVGLANDMIGYMSPPWAFTDVAGIYTAPPECQNDQDDVDSKGHKHKLETEGVGPTAGGLVADNLTGMLKQQGADAAAVIRRGRFVYPDGALGRSPFNAVGVWIAGDSASSPGTIVALPGITGFGTRGVDATGRAMDYDGAEQPADGDVTTRGMLVYACDGSVARRYYLDLYPSIDSPPKLGRATTGSVQTGCGAGTSGPRSGPAGTPQQPTGCRDRGNPFARVRRGAVKVSRKRVSVHGTARDRGCAGLRSVLVSVARPQKGGCRFVQANGRLSRRRGCSRRLELRARGTRSWKLALKAKLPRGRYVVRVRSVDKAGHRGYPRTVRVRVR
jgi:hypothetical protein